MLKKINFWSFIFSFVCVALFFISVSSTITMNFVINLVHTHPLNIVLALSLVTFFFGIVGLSGVSDPKTLIKSIITIIITFALSVMVAFIVFAGNWI